MAKKKSTDWKNVFGKITHGFLSVVTVLLVIAGLVAAGFVIYFAVRTGQAIQGL